MRRTKHRRRFHTDRIVRKRRAAYVRSMNLWELDRLVDNPEWYRKRLSWGYLSQTDPWDCGRARCGICHYYEGNERVREERAWRRDWGLL